MKRIQEAAGILISGFLAGLCIAIGGTVFLSVDNRVIGASLFSIGLFLWCPFCCGCILAALDIWAETVGGLLPNC